MDNDSEGKDESEDHLAVYDLGHVFLENCEEFLKQHAPTTSFILNAAKSEQKDAKFFIIKREGDVTCTGYLNPQNKILFFSEATTDQELRLISSFIADNYDNVRRLASQSKSVLAVYKALAAKHSIAITKEIRQVVLSLKSFKPFFIEDGETFATRITGYHDSIAVSWHEAFTEEVGLSRNAAASSKAVLGAYSNEYAYFLINSKGIPLTMAWATVIDSSIARISFVYTPQVHRGRGYAKTVLSHLVLALLVKGIRPILYTLADREDLIALYRCLGFEVIDYATDLSYTEI